ncbi:MAG: hypothetical protein L0Y71_07970 [Gemmataceae bacterium]|nr:hypothetical protein [Gemmataceae bacterium]
MREPTRDRKTRRPEPDDYDDEDDDRARKKKKKKKKPPASTTNWLKIAGFGGMGLVAVLFLVFIVWIIISLAGGGPPAQPVTEFAKFNSDGMEWGFEYPKGWQAAGYGLAGKREAEIKGPNATITVKENITGSLVGDVARALGGGQEPDDEFSPVAKVHDMRKPKDSKSYKEEPAVTVMTRFGKARRSAYTDGSRKGFRATVLLNQTALDVFCDCRASDWDALRPAFERSISTLGTGGQ